MPSDNDLFVTKRYTLRSYLMEHEKYAAIQLALNALLLYRNQIMASNTRHGKLNNNGHERIGVVDECAKRVLYSAFLTFNDTMLGE